VDDELKSFALKPFAKHSFGDTRTSRGTA